jgi:prepilin-type N-terminal cleavage/methylation domain-containing protein
MTGNIALKTKYNSKGFTLIELVIVIAIVSIILVAAVSAFAFGPGSFSNQFQSLSNQYKVRTVVRTVSREARHLDASEIKITYDGLHIGDNVYFFEDGVIYKNNILFFDGIKIFDYSVGDGFLSLTVAAEETKGKDISMTVEINVRE